MYETGQNRKRKEFKVEIPFVTNRIKDFIRNTDINAKYYFKS